MSDFLINTAEFNASTKQMDAFCDGMTEKLRQYHDTIRKIYESGISSGETHDALERYLSYIEPLPDCFKTLRTQYGSIVEHFITDVTAADKLKGKAFIYEKSTIRRDYTDAMLRELEDCLDDPWCELTDSFGDYLRDKLIKFADIFNIDLVREIFKKNHKVLLDYMDATRADLQAVFKAEWDIDATYEKRLKTFYLAYWDALEMIRGLSRVMVPLYAGTSNFSAAQIDAIMGGKYESLTKSMAALEDLPLDKMSVTAKQIADFVQANWDDSYFLDAMKTGSGFIDDIGFFTTAGITVFNMFDIAETEFAQFLAGTDGSFATLYNETMIKKELMAVIEEEVGKNPYKAAEYDEDIKDMKDFLKLFKKYGKEAYKYMNTHRIEEGGRLIMDGRTREAKKYNEMLEGLDNAGKILEYGDKAIDYFARAMTDYSKGLEILDSFAVNYEGDEMMTRVIAEIRGEYAKEFNAMIGNALDIAAEGSVDAAKEIFSSTPVGGVIKAIEAGIDLTGDVTGLGDKSEASYNAMLHYNLNAEANSAYTRAVEKFHQAIESGLDPSSEAYQFFADDVKNCFTLSKNNTVNMFNEMAKASSGAKSSYYSYCARQASQMTLQDSESPVFMSFEEYQKTYF